MFLSRSKIRLRPPSLVLFAALLLLLHGHAGLTKAQEQVEEAEAPGSSEETTNGGGAVEEEPLASSSGATVVGEVDGQTLNNDVNGTIVDGEMRNDSNSQIQNGTSDGGNATKGEAEKKEGETGSSSSQSSKIKVMCWDPRKSSDLPAESPDSDSASSQEQTTDFEMPADASPSVFDTLMQKTAEEKPPTVDSLPSSGDKMQEDESTAGTEEDDNTTSAPEEILISEKEAANITDLEMLNKTVEMVNMTSLLNDVLYQNPDIRTKAVPANCTVVLFHAPWCPFCAKAAPHYNALPRAYPPLRVVAIDTQKWKSVNTYFGILAVPTVALFHNGRLIAKFNDSQFTLNKFAEFVEHYTDLTHEERMNVTTRDFEGPLPSVPVRESDWLLLVAWVFLILTCTHYITKSVIWWRFVELVRTTWNLFVEHEHID